ncbi:hypothetical protein M0D69_16905 [Caballeronia sp. SEWSISQ10-4 2]|uniref:hypothetical protein n=1 Tax=Caballeronia sp. SEWSISQ10-4 2 TaxID=2937438 RepID=UPI00264AD655|nr:hypothetical protein [Caballeronia sp. SEWSISQ10-4 2]MDN7179637.1 hypothetical protein [Caballeronia sp. SEWSISQ10-4 2]
MERAETKRIDSLPAIKPLKGLVLAAPLFLAACNDMHVKETMACFGSAVMATARSTGAAKDTSDGKAPPPVSFSDCVAIHSSTQQTQDSSQVDDEYRRAHNGQLPDQPAIVTMDVRANPSGVVRRGAQLTIVSNLQVVSGKSEPVSAVSVEIRLYEYGKTEPFKTDTLSATTLPGSGAYKTSFTIVLPASMPQGQYRIETVFYLNRQRAGSTMVTLQIV